MQRQLIHALAIGLPLLTLLAVFPAESGIHQRPEPVQTRPAMIDPVFAPSKISDTFHMTPLMLYGDDFLKPWEFDFDMAIGTFGTDFAKTEKIIALKEDSEVGVYHDFAWRFGILDEIGSLRLPVELITELPLFYHTGSIDSYSYHPGNEGNAYTHVGSVDDDDVALGKWIWGLRFGLLPEGTFLPSLTLQTSLGIPLDDEVASDGVDYDTRLSLEKYFGLGITGSLYGGILFPGEGKDVFTDLGVDSEDALYAGLMTDTNLAQLCGAGEAGRVWLHLGASWRDALYDFGAIGPDYAEEEVKLTGGLSFDLGYWGPAIGCPQAMVGVNYMLEGGPEEGEVELVTRLNFPFEFDK
jgi:hypothetical protein